MEDLQKEYELKVVWAQSKDGNDGGEDYQSLRIESQNCGGGPYFILDTERWAFDKPEELLDLINEFIEKHGRLQSKIEKD